jgi:cbb3-type cytochrome oxidase subunit 3
MGVTEILIVLGLLFLLLLILAPVYYYFNKEKSSERQDGADESQAPEDPTGTL